VVGHESSQGGMVGIVSSSVEVLEVLLSLDPESEGPTLLLMSITPKDLKSIEVFNEGVVITGVLVEVPSRIN